MSAPVYRACYTDLPPFLSFFSFLLRFFLFFLSLGGDRMKGSIGRSTPMCSAKDAGVSFSLGGRRTRRAALQAISKQRQDRMERKEWNKLAQRGCDQAPRLVKNGG